MDLTITRVDPDRGLVTLSDRSRWQVVSEDILTMTNWLPGHTVAIAGSGPTRELWNKDRETTVRATAS